MSEVSKRVDGLRQLMHEKHIDLYLAPSTDAHNNEYLPQNWQRRPWISGFTGSAGEALIGLNDAFLWTDGRYFLQAEAELDASLYTLQKQGSFVPEIENWLTEHAQHKTFAVDPQTVSINRALKLKQVMKNINGKCLFETTNLVDHVRQNNNELPHAPHSQIFIQKTEHAGQSVDHKLTQIRQIIQDKKIDTLIITMLDEIAWLLNIRGNDVSFNPLVISYVIVEQDQCCLYIDISKINDQVKDHFEQHQITLKDYEHFSKDLGFCQGKVWVDSLTANYWVMLNLSKAKKIHFEQSPIALTKACKNMTEIDGAKLAHKKDALAVISFIYWLENHWHTGVDELQAQDKLLAFRQQQENFKGASFDTISGFASNGAIIHYRSSEKTTKIIDNNSLYLVDSGGQYLEGTTDITRVFHFGTPDSKEKRCYTLVLKGHLAIQRARFPKGTKGEQLDPVARFALWQEQLNYAHGTGHGVGSFLCVHEGPQRISPANSNQALLPGMIVSNEPGVYFPGKFGIRIENLCFVKTMQHQTNTDCGEFYQFEDLTLVPYASNLIDLNLLTNEEIRQINAYHQRVKEEVSPMIRNPEVLNWLNENTKPL